VEEVVQAVGIDMGVRFEDRDVTVVVGDPAGRGLTARPQGGRVEGLRVDLYAERCDLLADELDGADVGSRQ
jgi:hypothetical protein